MPGSEISFFSPPWLCHLVHESDLMAESLTWCRILRNAATQARLRVLACLRMRRCFDPVRRGAGGDVTKEFDHVAEQAVVEYLQEFAAFTLVSEEAGVQTIGRVPKGCVILDPIDGSINFGRKLPICCVSAAYGSEPAFEAVQAAVVLEVFSGSCFHAARGLGAFRDAQRIQPAPPGALDECVVGVDASFPSRIRSAPTMGKSSRGIRHIRHLGSNALELCYVADGTFDAFVDLRDAFRGTDLAAAWLVLRESGAALLNAAGEPLTGRCTNQERYSFVAASNLQLGRELLGLAYGKKE